MRSPWRLEQVAGLELIRCTALTGIPGLAHAFSTRKGQGGEAFDLGAAASDDAVVASRREALGRAAGLPGQGLVRLRQVHGDRLVRGALALGEAIEADGVVCLRDDRPRSVAAVRCADCVPVLLADETGRAVAAVHAGWRGTARGIVGRAVQALEELGVAARSLHAALGPAIGPCCYEVGDEVVTAVARASGVAPASLVEGSPTRLDLRRANAVQLEQAGLSAQAIHTADWCTACDGQLFFSARREGGPAGRMMACIGWPDHP